MIYKDGRKYEGNWKNGIWNGRGKYTFNDGFGYEGEWKNGVENGMGILTYLNGDKYEGEFKNGKMLNGKMYKKNGDIHVQKNNEWKIKLNNKFHPLNKPSHQKYHHDKNHYNNVYSKKKTSIFK